jgi:mRNA interferase YafQ
MLEIVKTKKFKKSLKLIRSKKNILIELDIILDILQFGKSMPPKYKDHELKGKLVGIRELHLGFDDLLLYFIRNEYNELVLVDIGTHAHTLGC